MNDFSLPLALFDFIPVILFTATSVILMRDLYIKMSKGAFALFAAGSFDIISAGALKALYKLLYALVVCNFTALDEVFFPLQSLGFMLSGLGLFALITHRQESGKKESRVALTTRRIVYPLIALIILIVLITSMTSLERSDENPPYFSGTFLFVTMMILGLALMEASLIRIAFTKKRYTLIILFLVSFISSLAMGYLSSRDFTLSLFNWIGEGVNTVGQLSLFSAVFIMHKSGPDEGEE